MATHNPINILEAFAAAPPPLDYVLPNMVAGTVAALMTIFPGAASKRYASGPYCFRAASFTTRIIPVPPAPSKANPVPRDKNCCNK